MLTSRLARLRSNASRPEFQGAVGHIREQARRAKEVRLELEAKQAANWGHYYHCRQDGARLQFSWNHPKTHKCPHCDQIWMGEPFDSAWVGLAHHQLGQLLKQGSILYAIEQDASLLEWMKETFLQYARVYETYVVHGDIPYNGPGKLFAQTLDEAHWILDLAMGYQYLEECFTSKERDFILEGLFRPCALFLIQYKEEQLHNHAVHITSAIAVLGFLLQDQEVQAAGLEGPYGLHDQLKRGVLADGFWYEGSFGYHYYVIGALIQYAVTVEGTAWDCRNDPEINSIFKSMFDHPLQLLLNNGKFANVNDWKRGDSIYNYIPYYEVALDWYGDEAYQGLLRELYSREGTSRDSYLALLFGKELMTLEQPAAERRELERLIQSDCSLAASGYTKISRPDGPYLFVKHSPFGGEHDHMDRLGISYGIGDIPLIDDPGTVAYAVPIHYAWFKHTYSHNTFCIDGHDQPPADGRRIAYEQESWGSWVVSDVNWMQDDYLMQGKILLPTDMCTWNEEAYRGCSITRINAVTSKLFLDVFRVQARAEQEIDILYHVKGEAADTSGWMPTSDKLSRLSETLFRDKRKKNVAGSQSMAWNVENGYLVQASWCSSSGAHYLTYTPDNPPDQERHSLIQRTCIPHSGEVWFVNVFYHASAYTQASVRASASPCSDANGSVIRVEAAYGTEHAIFTIHCSEDKARVEWGV
ncbi:heparinase II/III family protein [Paenibacillus sp. PL2-23]|uniref:heparinase II/III domain-containing protein n=1 Tax=Paenibacillus sp. PL2-23 TaxID=2100729 RepID=UPI0030FBA7F1